MTNLITFCFQINIIIDLMLMLILFDKSWFNWIKIKLICWVENSVFNHLCICFSVSLSAFPYFLIKILFFKTFNWFLNWHQRLSTNQISIVLFKSSSIININWNLNRIETSSEILIKTVRAICVLDYADPLNNVSTYSIPINNFFSLPFLVLDYRHVFDACLCP